MWVLCTCQIIYYFMKYLHQTNQGAAVVKWLGSLASMRSKGLGSHPILATIISKMWYLLLQIILPSFNVVEIPVRIKESDWYRNNPGRFLERFFILLPASARAPSLEDADHRIRHMGNIKVNEKLVAGHTRTYSVQVYRVSADNGEVRESKY